MHLPVKLQILTHERQSELQRLTHSSRVSEALRFWPQGSLNLPHPKLRVIQRWMVSYYNKVYIYNLL